MPESTVVENLRAARDLLLPPERWTTRFFAKSEQSSDFGVSIESPDATCFCGIGAICRVTHRNHSSLAVSRLTMKEMGRNPRLAAQVLHEGVLLHQAALELYPESHGWIPSVNDELGHDAVLKVYDFAIANAILEDETA